MENVKPNTVDGLIHTPDDLLTLAKNYKRMSNEYFKDWESCTDVEMQGIYWLQQEEYENKARGILFAYNLLTGEDIAYFQI